MKLSAPMQVTFLIGAILWFLGLLGAFAPAINGLFTAAGMGAAYWLAILGGLVLIIGNLYKRV
jgi:hypothetical protein